ncbi:MULTISPECIES: hypothetical protein [unclassified Pseudonocardia]|uniref:hypothetical protein n=1 Tax=Pseudonocardia sp. Ae150A_Ps1 TaxID=1885028 RepID=UPI0020161149|nr:MULTISPECIES: hypothetical protein [unclassified Pseudonocardia]
MRDVRGGGALGDAELAGDLGVGRPDDEHRQDLQLARGQPGGEPLHRVAAQLDVVETGLGAGGQRDPAEQAGDRRPPVEAAVLQTGAPHRTRCAAQVRRDVGVVTAVGEAKPAVRAHLHGEGVPRPRRGARRSTVR